MQKGTSILHYTILEKLGEGGMGVVYKARDNKLSRDVSLKFVPGHASVDKENHDRFLQEARSIAQINHPNICQIYAIEVDEHGNQFIVMEFIDGANLYDSFISKLKNSITGTTADPESDKSKLFSSHPEQVLNYAIQIVKGLDAAHNKGVIHRDIKPANIMVSSSHDVKILDFGLAKISGVDQHTQVGSTLGTISYMSPEQIRGEELGPESDIWSFGIVLYEMLSGRNPFGGDYQHSVMYTILNTDPPPVKSYSGEIPEGLNDVIERCLSKSLSERYQSAGELLRDLAFIAGSSTSGIRTRDKKNVNKLPEAAPNKKRTLLAASGIFAVLILLSLVGFMGYQTFQNRFMSYGAESIHVAVLPFTNIGADPARQVFADGLVETITSQLSQLERFQKDLWVVPSGEVRSLNVSSAGEAHRMFKVNYVIAGSLQPIADRLRLTVTLIDSRNLRQLNSSVIDVDANDVMALQEKSVESLLTMLNLELNPETIGVIREVKTSVPAAFELYIQGLGYLQRYERIDNIDNAILAFEEAIELDSQFALAHAALGQAYWRKYENTRERTWIDLATEQSHKAFNLNSKLLQAHITLGMIRNGTGRYNEAVDHFLDALSTDPTNADAYRGLARAYEFMGNLADAESTYKRAIQLKPDYWAGYNVLGAFYFRNNNFDEAREQFRIVTELTPDNYRGYLNLGSVHYITGKLDEARAMFEHSLQLEETFSAASNLGTLYYAEGLYAEAAKAYETAIEINDSHYYLWGNLAVSYYYAPGMRQKSFPVYEKAIEVALAELDINPKDSDVLISLAGYHARLGNKQQSIDYIREALEVSPDDAIIHYLAGTAFETLGNRDDALIHISKAIQGGYPESEIKKQPELQNLIDDPRFQIIQTNSGQLTNNELP
ncbi:MAG: hypothetical protein EA359_17080 [Balneolaceae bacterium]|nr:MAG: hypothetical protein EA359_17080 [Balneolaceae bacterium]